MRILGIDPGLDGAMAVIDEFNTVVIIPTPTVNSKTSSGKNKRLYDIAAMVDALKEAIPNPMVARAGLELVHAMPGQGVTSMFSMGLGLGIWQGILAALKIPCEMITPQEWKGVVMKGMAKDKDASRIQAMRLYPEIQLHKKCDHNKAEALLIAEYVRRHFGGAS